jgi:hypothetical protein
MSTPAQIPRTWADVHCSRDDEPTITCRTALAVYEESFANGQFCARGWNGAGRAWEAHAHRH